MKFRIRSIINDSAINFIDDDDGERLDEIAAALQRVLGLTMAESAGNPLEEVRLLKGMAADFILTWDGYFTELRILKGGVRIADVFRALEKDEEFSA